LTSVEFGKTQGKVESLLSKLFMAAIKLRVSSLVLKNIALAPSALPVRKLKLCLW